MRAGGEGLFGSAPESPQPFRGPGWENQGEILNAYMMGQFMTPEMLQAQQQRTDQLRQQWEASGGNQQQQQWGFQYNSPAALGGGMGQLIRDPRTGLPVMPGYQNAVTGGDDALRQQYEQSQRITNIMEQSKPYWNQNRFTPGMELAGQMAPTIGTAAGVLDTQNSISDLQAKIAALNSNKQSGWAGAGQGIQRALLQRQIQEQQRILGQQQASIAEATPQFAARNPYQFSNAMNAYQFQDPTQGMTAQQMVGDAFTPQYEMAQRMAQKQGAEDRQQILNDMNRRGMLTSGAATRAMQMQQRDQGDRLANLSSQLAANQAQQMLGAGQYLQGMGWQRQQAQAGEAARQQAGEWARQQSQAEEIFRQQGATDAQASQLAQMALQRQAQAFQQQQAGRQQGISEWALQQQMARQPMEDLFRLYQLSTGGSPGSPGNPGLISQLIPAGATLGAAALMCLPEGTPIETAGGGTMPVEMVEPGDEVNGGTVLQVSKSLRPRGHQFFRHVFKSGKEVVMSEGHPFHDDLDWKEPVHYASDFTHDIRTSGGFYMVNGVRLGSTLG